MIDFALLISSFFKNSKSVASPSSVKPLKSSNLLNDKGLASTQRTLSPSEDNSLAMEAPSLPIPITTTVLEDLELP